VSSVDASGIGPSRSTGAVPANEGRSWWLREAMAADPGEPCPPLRGDRDADVVILGGGYTGMWTAYQLRLRDPGLHVVLLEADICGGGASGRNGGFVNGFWNGIGENAEHLGADAAITLARAADPSIVEIGEFCDRHGVDAWYTHGGDLGVATSPAQEGAWRSTLAAAKDLGVEDEFMELSPEEVAKRCRSPAFGGGIYTHSAATVQPARLARGLRRVLLDMGVEIHEGTPVRAFRAGRPAVAEAAEGRVRARTAVLALNAWMEHWRAFRSRVTVRGSYMVITAPAAERLDEISWTGGEAVWNFRAAVDYLRTTPDGRIAFGTGGMQPGFARSIGPRFGHDPRFVRRVAEHLWRLFPSFRDVPLEAAWGGPIDVSSAHVPFFGTMPSGNVHYGVGYTGNGVGPSHLGGKILAALSVGAADEVSHLPVVGLRPRRFPPEPIRSPGMLVANQAILRKDEAEDDGLRPDPLTRFVATLPRRLGYNLGP
jgi:glycine/D-amino acid oxidase-like deaminating enzyme